MSFLRSSLAWSGSMAGPLAWAISTQANYSWVTLRCGNAAGTPILTVALVLLPLLGAFASWRALASLEAAPAEAPRKPRTERSIALVCIGMGVLFALGIALQAAATFVFTGCER